MSLYGAMIAGVSGLKAQSTNLATISDNIANLNTTAYKRTQGQRVRLFSAGRSHRVSDVRRGVHVRDGGDLGLAGRHHRITARRHLRPEKYGPKRRRGSTRAAHSVAR